MDFYSTIHQHYEAIFPLNPQQVAWIKRLELSSGASVLDIGCATGQLAFALAENGFQVEAFDLDEAMIASARRKARGDNPRFKAGDMLELETLYPDREFDLALCFGNTLVHLQGNIALLNFFKSVANRLKPGGRFLGQILNYDYILQEQIQKLPLIDNEVLTFVREYEYPGKDSILFKTKLIIKPEGKEIENCIPLYPVRRHLLEQMLALAGFINFQFYSSFNGEPYQEKSMPLVFEARLG